MPRDNDSQKAILIRYRQGLDAICSVLGQFEVDRLIPQCSRPFAQDYCAQDCFVADLETAVARPWITRRAALPYCKDPS